MSPVFMCPALTVAALYAIRPQFLGFLRRFFSACSACFSKRSYAASLFSCSSVICSEARMTEGGESQTSDPNAMPLRDFISEAMQILKSEPLVEEVLVKRVHPH